MTYSLIFNVATMSFNVILENKILAKISEFTIPNINGSSLLKLDGRSTPYSVDQ